MQCKAASEPAGPSTTTVGAASHTPCMQSPPPTHTNHHKHHQTRPHDTRIHPPTHGGGCRQWRRSLATWLPQSQDPTRVPGSQNRCCQLPRRAGCWLRLRPKQEALPPQLHARPAPTGRRQRAAPGVRAWCQHRCRPPPAEPFARSEQERAFACIPTPEHIIMRTPIFIWRSAAALPCPWWRGGQGRRGTKSWTLSLVGAVPALVAGCGRQSTN
jgi:hypothetical protein